ncbi:MAG: ABC transporter permease, partial [Serpentinimonas sp.]|nr:ABC transporter permease [Serpentinimonas sp.]
MNGFAESLSTAATLVVTGDLALWTVVARSLAVSATACLLACSLGLLLGAWLGVARFPGRDLLLTLG